MTRAATVLVSCAVLGTTLSMPVARAGTYDVVACKAAPNRTNHAWSAVNQDATTIAIGDGCADSGTEAGLFAEDRLGPGPVPTAASLAYFEIAAPSGTTIDRLAYQRYLQKRNDDGAWRLELRNGAGVTIESCNTAPDCESGTAGSGAARAFGSLATRVLRFGIWCVPIAPSTGCDHGATLHSAQAVLYGATVTIDDPVAPTDASLSGVPTGWTNTGFTATVGGSDNVSVSARTVQIDGQELGRTGASCDYTYTVPCPASGNAAVPVALGSLEDGEHEVTGVVYDPGGLAAVSAAQIFRLDRHAPATPVPSRVGGRYSPETRRSIELAIPGGQAAPVTTARTQVCVQGSNDCAPAQEAAISDASRTVTAELPSDGLYDVHAWLRDAAGNEDPGRDAIVELGRDSVAPRVSLRTSHAGAVADGTTVVARYDQSDPSPSSGQGASGFELSVDGAPFAADDGSFLVAAGHTYRVRAYVSDQAGNRTTTASTQIDGVSAPAAAAQEPAPAAPQPHGSDIGLTAPAPARTAPRMTVRSLVAAGHLRLTARLPGSATGSVRFRLSVWRGNRRIQARAQNVSVDHGRARWTPRVPRHATRLAVTAAYSGDSRLLPVRRTRRLAVR